MIEAALPHSGDFTDCGLDADLILERLVARLTSPDHTKPAMITAFRALYGPALHTACNDHRLKQALDPALIREQMRQQREQGKMIQQVLAGISDLKGAVNTPNGPSLADLKTVAGHFGNDTLTTSGEIVKFLSDKADDMSRLSDELELMRGLSDRIDNIISATASAVKHHNLAEARTLLDNAREVQTEALRKPLEINATLMEKTSEIDLIEGRAQDAYTTLSAAADSFASIDPVEPARRRVTYADLLYAHGLRYGGPGLALSVKMFHTALERIDPTQSPDLWVGAQNNLGLALQNQGTRTAGKDGTDLLASAVTAFQAALTIRTKADHPVDWAMTRENLALCELDRADHSATTDPRPHLEAALDHVKAALTVYDPEHMPYDFGTASALRDDIKARLQAG